MTTITVSSGVVSSGLSLAASDVLDVLSGGAAISTTVGAHAFETVEAGGQETSGSVKAAGTVEDFGAVSGLNVASGAQLQINAGGFAHADVIAGTETVAGVASGETLSSGGELDLFSGGLAKGVVVHDGAKLALLGGSAVNDVIKGGGELLVLDTIQSGETFTYSGLHVAQTTSFQGVVLSSGALLSMGTVTVASGGVLSLAAGADLTQAVSVAAGGHLLGPGPVGSITDAGVVSGAIVSGATESIRVLKGGLAIGDTLLAGGAETLSSGATASGERVSAGGLEIVRGGAHTISGLVGSGGILRIGSGGLSSKTVVLSGGSEVVSAHGVARGTLLSGGAAIVYGVTSFTQVNSGGIDKVQSLGTASASLIGAGGREIVSSGGVAYGAHVLGGGTLVVRSGAFVSGGMILSGGKAIISSVVSAGQTVNFATNSGTLELHNAGGFHAAISGFTAASEKIDLANFQFTSSETVSWAQQGTSGTLTVRDGAKVARFTLVGTYATSNFHLASDGHSGTFVSDPAPPKHIAPARLVEAAALLAGGRSSDSQLTVHSGGNASTAPALVGGVMSAR